MKIEVTLPPSAAGDLADVMSTYGLSLDDAVATSRLTLPGMGEAKTELLEVDAPTPSPEFVSAERRRAEIDAMAERDPGKTAELLRGLMDDRQPA